MLSTGFFRVLPPPRLQGLPGRASRTTRPSPGTLELSPRRRDLFTAQPPPPATPWEAADGGRDAGGGPPGGSEGAAADAPSMVSADAGQGASAEGLRVALNPQVAAALAGNETEL